MIEYYILTHNNLFCAEYQIKTIRKFCKDPFKIVMIDSNCGRYPDITRKLKTLCDSKSVELLTIPNNLAMDGCDGTLILGTKLNYVYNVFVKHRQPKYFAFLDQDMFMFKPFSIIPFLDERGMWGDVDEPDNAKTPSLNKTDIVNGPWKLHPWLSFYKYDFVKDYPLDFMPCQLPDRGNFDTGGKLWETFVSKLPLNKRDYWLRENIRMLFPFEEVSNAGPKPYETHYFMLNGKKVYGQVQINNGFIHMLNSPNDILHPKVAFVKGFLEACLNG